MTNRAQDNKKIREDMRKKRFRPEKSTSVTSNSGRRRRGRIRTVSVEELREEYSYVLKDLRRIFILAVAMFVLLIAANLIYPFLAG
ncbi:MAG: hypothetical protein ACI9EW_001112 [Cellvibrionaceae bacterium]|jgi:hypothetical protein